MESLYGISLFFSDDAAAKLLHYSFGIGTMGVLYCMGRRYSSTLAGTIAALLFVSPPFVGFEFMRSGVELGSSFFLASAVMAFLVGFDSADSAIDTRSITYAGIL